VKVEEKATVFADKEQCRENLHSSNFAPQAKTPNAAAIDYAHATRWTPGTMGGEPRAMQASLTVILGERG
jgi:hypothetical protein